VESRNQHCEGLRELTLSDLSAFGTSLRAVLALRRAS